MKIELAFKNKKVYKITFQDKFPTITKCCYCKGNSRLAFVAHEWDDEKKYVKDIYKTTTKKLWLHDACCVAVYFCEKCLEATALYNQA